MCLCEEGVGPLRRPAAPAGPAEQHGEGDEALLDAVVQVALDPPPFGVHGRHHRGPAGRQFVDAPDEQRVGGGPETDAGQAPVLVGQGAQPLEVEEEQDAAEERLRQQLRPADRGADGAPGQQDREQHPEDQKSGHDGAEQPGVGAGRQIAQDGLILGAVLGEGAAEEARPARAFQRDQLTGSRDQGLTGPGPRPRPEQEGTEGGPGHQEVGQAEQGGEAAEEEPGGSDRARGRQRAGGSPALVSGHGRQPWRGPIRRAGHASWAGGPEWVVPHGAGPVQSVRRCWAGARRRERTRTVTYPASAAATSTRTALESSPTYVSTSSHRSPSA